MNSLKIIISAYAVFIAVTGAYGESLECPQICPDMLEPTCGTDGIEYVKFDNRCEMNIFNCKRERSTLSTYSKTDMDWCTTTELKDDLVLNSKDLQKYQTSCMKPCPMILRPVCASNGTHRKTFSNDCEMKMFDCINRNQRKNGWRILRNSSCSV